MSAHQDETRVAVVIAVEKETVDTKMRHMRQLLLCLVVVLILMCIYFALLPSHHAHSHTQGAPLLPRYQSPSVELPPSNSSVWGEGVGVALEVYRQHGLVLFTMINDAYLPFTLSWLCNTEPLGVHKYVVILTADNASSRILQQRWPTITSVSLNMSALSGSLEYSKAGYVMLMVERTRFILRLLEAGVRLLLFEVDCTWLADPLPTILSPPHGAHILPGHLGGHSVDIVATRVSGQDITAGGFLLLTPTPRTITLWRHLTAMMNDLATKLRSSARSAPVSEALNDQQFFSQLLQKKYAGVKVTYLSQDAFPDGKWYTHPASVRSRNQRPIIINNNWVMGNDAKQQRAKTFEHWFLKDGNSSGACNQTAVKRLFLGSP